jgi:signal transduction histidine kinase
MFNRFSLSKQDGQKLFKWRWAIILGIGLFIVIIEIFLHSVTSNIQQNYLVIIELFLDFALLVTGGVLLGLLERTALERATAFTHLTLRDALSRQVSSAANYNQVVRIIVDFPHNIVPVMGSVLLLYEPSSDLYKPEAIWGFYGVTPPAYVPFSSAELCESCAMAISHATPAAFQCTCKATQSPVTKCNRYCLTLVKANTAVALLHIYLPENAVLTQDQQELFTSLSPDMALALDDAKNKRLNYLLMENVDADHRRIARDLHDNLVQSLIYLRYKLEQLTGEKALVEIEDVQRDLQHLREVADEAYIAARSTIKDIKTNSSTDLMTALSEYTHSIEERVNYSFCFDSQGQPKPLPADIARQVVYIYKEILANIEKHADAKKVGVKLDWKNDNLLMTVMDDGRGFQVNHDQSDEHQGLSIIRERAEEINGRIFIKSSLGEGTEVTLNLPLRSNDKGKLYLE